MGANYRDLDLVSFSLDVSFLVCIMIWGISHDPNTKMTLKCYSQQSYTWYP